MATRVRTCEWQEVFKPTVVMALGMTLMVLALKIERDERRGAPASLRLDQKAELRRVAFFGTRGCGALLHHHQYQARPRRLLPSRTSHRGHLVSAEGSRLKYGSVTHHSGNDRKR